MSSASANCRTFKCQRVGTCRLADAEEIITFDDEGERLPVCPLKYEHCDKELKPFVVKTSAAWKLYAGIAGGVILLLVVLFAVTGSPSEEQRREAVGKELKEIWPWLQVR